MLRRRHGHRGHGWLKDTAVRARGVARQTASGVGSLARRAAPHMKAAVGAASHAVLHPRETLRDLREGIHEATSDPQTRDQEEAIKALLRKGAAA